MGLRRRESTASADVPGVPTEIDILGEYACCHECGLPNKSAVLNRKLGLIERDLQMSADIVDDASRRRFEQLLGACVSDLRGQRSTSSASFKKLAPDC